jgi:hypothetical protein
MQDFESMSQEHRKKEREIVSARVVFVVPSYLTTIKVVEMEQRYSAKYGSPPVRL